MRTSLGTIPLPDTISRHNTSVISLGQVRSGPRVTNEYVDSPRVHTLQPLKAHLISVSGGGGGSSPGFAHHVILPSPVGEANGRSSRSVFTSSPAAIVTHQPLPKSPPLKKEPVISLDGNREGEECQSDNNLPVGGGHGESIICDKCGKCRCVACTEPRTLPTRWCCHGTCEVSLNKALDVCTCFCCIKCIFYHCGTEEDNECYEKPCGCSSTPHCCQRWTLMGVMALCLPCLWTYWPAKACQAGCTMCYNHCRHSGCQCHQQLEARACGGSGTAATAAAMKTCTSAGGRLANKGSTSGSRHSQTRRLLIESDSSSA